MATEPDSELLARIDAALVDQKVIEAIRLYREAMQVSLIEGRRFIEARQALLPSAAPAEQIADAVPEQVRRYLGSGHARPGDLLAWWRNPRGDYCVLVRYASAPQPLFEIGVFPPVVGHWGHDLNGLRCDLPQLVDALMGEGFPGAEWGRGHPVIATISVALHASLQMTVAPLRPSARPGRSALFLLDAARFERDWLCLPARISPAWWESQKQRIATEAEIADLASETDIVLDGAADCPPSAGPLLWALCHAECATDCRLADSSDSLFADIEAQPPAWRELGPAALQAWHLLLASVDTAARRRAYLPWWLQAAAMQSSASVGLLSPVECRQLAAQADELIALFNTHPAQADIVARLQLCQRASEGGHWLLGWEAAG